MNSLNNLEHQIKLVQERLETLQESTDKSPSPSPEIQEEAIAELAVTLEELQQQNEELGKTRGEVEFERQRYQELFEYAPDGYLVTDVGGIIQDANRAAATLLNVSQEHLLGKPLLVFVTQADKQNFHLKLNQLSELALREISGQPLYQDWELYLQPLKSQGFPSSIAVSAMYKHGKLTGLRWLIRDISDRKQAEQVVCQQLVKERELNELKSRFINTVSHEFRTPLSVILNSAEMLEGYSDRLSEAKKSNHFHKMRLSIGYMVQLLEDILFYGKAEANKLEFNPALLELEDFCHALVEEVRVSAKEGQDIVFSSKCDRTSVCLDPKLLKQLLGNLLSNAIKYSSKGSIIQFKTICENSQAIFQIQDSGIGIPKEDIPHLFEPFHRAKNATTISGTGLGLTIVKKAVDLHRGTISVESEIGTGTTFTVTLPCSPT